MDTSVLEALHAIESGANADEREGLRLEFKQDRGSFDKTVEALVEATTCLANADGGHVVLGVADKSRGTAAFTGTDRDTETLRSSIRESSNPALDVGVEEFRYAGARLIVFQVLRSSRVHQDKRGATRRRFRSSCPRLSTTEIATLERTKQGFDWSAEPSDRPLTSVDENDVAPLRTRLERKKSELGKASIPDLMRGLGLVDGDDRLLNAASLLLFGLPESAGHRVLYQYKPSAGAESRPAEYLREPLPALLERLMRLIRERRNTTPFNFRDGTQIALSDFPEEAVREAVANALLHCDHALGEAIDIEHTPDSLVVHSPGALVDGVTVNNILTHPSRPRNRCLFGAAHQIGLAERTGRGIDRMYRELLRAGQPPPRIDEETLAVRVAFLSRRPQTELLRLIEELPESLAESLDVRLALFTLLSRKTVSAEDLAPIVQRRVDEVAPVLESLAHGGAGIVEPTLNTAHDKRPRYRFTASALRELGPAVPYHRQRPRDLERKVLAHLTDYGWINNRTLQTLFDIDLQVARRRLDGLRRRGIVEKLDGPQRGPGVRYGIGPKARIENDED